MPLLTRVLAASRRALAWGCCSLAPSSSWCTIQRDPGAWRAVVVSHRFAGEGRVANRRRHCPFFPGVASSSKARHHNLGEKETDSVRNPRSPPPPRVARLCLCRQCACCPSGVCVDGIKELRWYGLQFANEAVLMRGSIVSSVGTGNPGGTVFLSEAIPSGFAS